MNLNTKADKDLRAANLKLLEETYDSAVSRLSRDARAWVGTELAACTPVSSDAYQAATKIFFNAAVQYAKAKAAYEAAMAPVGPPSDWRPCGKCGRVYSSSDLRPEGDQDRCPDC